MRTLKVNIVFFSSIMLITEQTEEMFANEMMT